MTAVSPVAPSPVRASVFVQPVAVLNLLLFGLCAIALAYFVSGANSIASQEYHVLSLRSQIALLNEQQSALTAEKTATEDPEAAALYAQDRNMVEAKDIFHVFENGSVALRR